MESKQQQQQQTLRQKRDAKIVGMEAGVQSFVERHQSVQQRQQQQHDTPSLLTIEQAEEEAHSKQLKNPFYLLVLQYVAAVKVFSYYLITLDTIIACALCAGLTCFWYFTSQPKSSEWYGGGMDWIILGFAVVTPMTSSFAMALTRREKALIEISRVRSFAFQIYLAHALWDWPDNGGRLASGKDWLHHCDKILAQLVGIGDELARFLSLPTSSRSIHRMTTVGRQEAARIVKVAYLLFDSMQTQRMVRLTTYDERLKTAGLPATEVSRIRQYERFMGEAMENLRVLKMYRTPQALRSLARIFTLILPAFYAPTFAQLARDVQSLGMGIAFGLLIAVGLTGLFESIQVLEDPFVGFITLDGINVREELEVLHWQQLVNARRMLFPNAPPFPEGTRTALVCGDIPELLTTTDHDDATTTPLVPKPQHKRVSSWDHQTLSEFGFGSYVGDFRPETRAAMTPISSHSTRTRRNRDRLLFSHEGGSMRKTHFAPYLPPDDTHGGRRDQQEPSSAPPTPPRQLFQRGKKQRGSDHSGGAATL